MDYDDILDQLCDDTDAELMLEELEDELFLQSLIKELRPHFTS